MKQNIDSQISREVQGAALPAAEATKERGFGRLGALIMGAGVALSLGDQAVVEWLMFANRDLPSGTLDFVPPVQLTAGLAMVSGLVIGVLGGSKSKRGE